jgi:hypothetical protein
MKFIILSTLLILCSCTPQRRFERLITRHPELLTTQYIVVRDTIRITVPEVHVDTIVDKQTLVDTIYLEKEQLKVKVWMKGEKVYIQGKCDTVYIDKMITTKVPVKIYEKTPVWKKIINFIVTLIFIVVILYILYRLIRKYLF